MNNNHPKKTIIPLLAIISTAIILTSSGCFTTQRNGQVFLSTLEDFDRVARPPTGDRGFLALFDPFVYVTCGTKRKFAEVNVSLVLNFGD